MTTFTITERGGWWFPVIRHRNFDGRRRFGYLDSLPIEYAGCVGILEAARAVQDVWPQAQLVAIK